MRRLAWSLASLQAKSVIKLQTCYQADERVGEERVERDGGSHHVRHALALTVCSVMYTPSPHLLPFRYTSFSAAQQAGLSQVAYEVEDLMGFVPYGTPCGV